MISRAYSRVYVAGRVADPGAGFGINHCQWFERNLTFIRENYDQHGLMQTVVVIHRRECKFQTRFSGATFLNFDYETMVHLKRNLNGWWLFIVSSFMLLDRFLPVLANIGFWFLTFNFCLTFDLGKFMLIIYIVITCFIDIGSFINNFSLAAGILPLIPYSWSLMVHHANFINFCSSRTMIYRGSVFSQQSKLQWSSG